MLQLLLPLALLASDPSETTASAQDSTPEPVMSVAGRDFATWTDYIQSDVFKARGLRCYTPERDVNVSELVPPSDCSLNSTNPDPVYDPGAVFRIPVVVHVIQRTNGQGFISQALVESQIQILNEDFRALPGSNGAPGFDTGIEFYLATVDPMGNPTNGITYSTNNNWYNDSGSYWNSLAWDTDRYLNIYTNSASGALGYVPGLPQGGIVGSNADRVVVLWSSFGLNGPIGPPYNKGRTTTHEVGHYLGLYHTFDGGCGSNACYNTGDLVCDTNRESGPNFSCGGGTSTSCGSTDPDDNYMNYSDDLCMERFTQEQARRMRCTMEFYRPQVYSEADAASNYCQTSPNSAGSGATMGFSGSVSVSDQNMTFSANGAPAGVSGLFFLGPNQVQTSFGNGFRCVGGATSRMQPVVSVNGSGVASRTVDWARPYASAIQALAGSSVNVQFWFRDPSAGGAAFNLSDGIEVPLLP